MSTPAELRAPQVSDLGERGLIERIRQRLPLAPTSVIVGIGDDAAVATPERGALQILTTDALVEGVHFDRRFSTLADVGYKALAVNASDVAAMGGSPQLALLSLMLPDSTSAADIDALLDGVVQIATEGKMTVVGGNVTRSPGPLIVDVTVTGAVRPRKILTRGGARPGDILYVTGTIGAGAAGLHILRERSHELGPAGVPDEDPLAYAVSRYRRPAPRLRIGALLGRNRAASACMDLSDGLADAVRQIAGASGTGAKLDAAALPLDEGARAWFGPRLGDALMACVSGGDDYELLFASPRRFRGRLRSVQQLAAGVAITPIGEVTAAKDLVIVRDGRSEPLPQGFTHF